MIAAEKVGSFALVVAREINEAATDYPGPRWETVDGREKAVHFTVTSPSLAGRSFEGLHDGEVSFGTNVYLAEDYSYQDSSECYQSVRVLGIYVFELEVADGVYTGNVTVWEQSSDFDF